MAKEVDVMSDIRELSDYEQSESLPFVCYDRSMFHYFQRINKFNFFKVLFIDRYLGFQYSDGNEPLLPYNYNGFDKLKANYGVDIESTVEELSGILTERFSNGYMAYAMLKTVHKDGSFYNTNTLIEDIKGDIVYITKTNETMRKVYTPITINELLDRFPLTEEGKVSLSFIKADQFFEKHQNLKIENVLKNILIGEYQYEIKHGNLYRDKKVMVPNCNAFQKLIGYFENEEPQILENGINKKNQLRMYKHIANKINPILNCWEMIIEFDDDDIIRESITNVRNDLKSLFKWFSLLNSKLNKAFYKNYMVSLIKLSEDYSVFQNSVHSYVLSKEKK